MSVSVGTLNIDVNARVDTVEAQLAKVSARVDAFTKKAESAGKGSTQAWMASSAALRVMEGGFEGNIRAAARFLASSQAVSKVLVAAFPVIGAIAFIGVIAKAVNELHNMAKAMQEAQAATTRAFGSLAVNAQSSVDELQLHILKTQDEMNKLLGKPSVNGPKEAFVEAKIAADDLAKSTIEAANQIASLLKERNIGFFQSVFSGKQNLNELQGSANSFQADLTSLALEKQQHPTDATATKNYNDKLAAYVKWLQTYVHSTDPKNTEVYGNHPEFASAFSLQRTAAQGLLSQALSQQQLNVLTPQAKQGDTALEQARLKKEADDKAKAAAEKAAAEQRKLQEDIIHDQNEGLESLKALHDASLDEEVRYWQARIAQAQTGSLSYRHAYDELLKSMAAVKKADSSEGDKQGKQFTSFATEQAKQNEEAWKKELTASRELQLAQEKLGDSVAAAQEKIAEKVAESNVQWELATGRISKHDAAMQMTAIHTRAYEQDLAQLQAELKQAQDIGDISEQAKLQLQMTDLQGNRSIQAASDQRAEFSSTTIGAATEALREWTQAATDSASQIREIIGHSLDSLNSDIMLGGRDWQRRKAFQKTGEDLFRSVGKAGLSQVEGNVLKGLGFGSKKPTGTASDPLYVTLSSLSRTLGPGGLPGITDNWGGDASETGGSSTNPVDRIIGGLASFIPGFGGHLAQGGDVYAGMSYDVGEMGRETFVPTTNGKIVPNSKSGGSVNYTIDARGASAAEVEQRVRGALMEVHGASVRSSVATQRDIKRRGPASKR